MLLLHVGLWLCGNDVKCINEATLSRAGLVLRPVTVLTRPTQPGYPSLGIGEKRLATVRL